MKLIYKLLVVFGFLSLTSHADAQANIQFEERLMNHDGRVRRFLLYVPPTYDGAKPVPLMFLLHGGGGSPDIYEDVTHMGQVARDEGFILVYPAGTGAFGNKRLLTWNAGYCCAYAMENQVDDVGFFREMVTALTEEFNIDLDHIYAAGHSNGGMMTYRLAAEMSDVFSAVGIVAGTIGGYPTPDSDELQIILQPENPVSVIHIHGMADDTVRYEGGINDPDSPSNRNDLSVADAIDFWVTANQCDPTPQHDISDDEMVITDTYTCEATDTTVKLISIVDGGHSWAGGDAPSRRSDQPSERVSSTDEIWAFFAALP